MLDPIHGLRILVTGATSGIGEVLVRRLADRGSTVLVHGRDDARVRDVTAALQASGAAAEAFVADLASLAEVAGLARAVTAAGALDVLVNNAGIGFGSNRAQREVSADGFELRLAVNFLAPFLLTERLTACGLPTRRGQCGVRGASSARPERPDERAALRRSARLSPQQAGLDPGHL